MPCCKYMQQGRNGADFVMVHHNVYRLANSNPNITVSPMLQTHRSSSIRTIPSVSDLHRINCFCSSWTITTDSELHSTLKLDELLITV